MLLDSHRIQDDSDDYVVEASLEMFCHKKKCKMLNHTLLVFTTKWGHRGCNLQIPDTLEMHPLKYRYKLCKGVFSHAGTRFALGLPMLNQVRIYEQQNCQWIRTAVLRPSSSSDVEKFGYNIVFYTNDLSVTIHSYKKFKDDKSLCIDVYSLEESKWTPMLNITGMPKIEIDINPNDSLEPVLVNYMMKVSQPDDPVAF